MKIEDVSRTNYGTQVVVSLWSHKDDPNSPRWSAAAKQLKSRLNINGEYVGVDLREDRGRIWAQFSYAEPKKGPAIPLRRDASLGGRNNSQESPKQTTP